MVLEAKEKEDKLWRKYGKEEAQAISPEEPQILVINTEGDLEASSDVEGKK